MGMRCKEVHICGGMEAQNIVKKITLACGDDFQLNEYKRFSELTVANKSLATHPNQPGAYKWVSWSKDNARTVYALSVCFTSPV